MRCTLLRTLKVLPVPSLLLPVERPLASKDFGKGMPEGFLGKAGSSCGCFICQFRRVWRGHGS
eukprot:5918715-Pyramimonas_sp.AAC.1